MLTVIFPTRRYRYNFCRINSHEDQHYLYAPQTTQYAQVAHNTMYQPYRFLAPSLDSTQWLQDTDANFHSTPDLLDLHAASNYIGNGRIHVGNGEGLRISHTGKSIIHTPQKNLFLSNILHVPQISSHLP